MEQESGSRISGITVDFAHPDDPRIELGSKLADREPNAGFIATSLLQNAAADRRLILAAAASGEYAGHLFFYRAKREQRIKIIQTLTNPELRGRGVGTKLVKFLVANAGSAEFIHLHSVRGSGQAAFWRRCGFHSVGEKRGRGLTPRMLTEFRKQIINSSHLFATTYTETPLAAMDMNILLDIQDNRTDESRTLHSLEMQSSEFNLCIPCTVLEEIDQIENFSLRQRRRSLALAFDLQRGVPDALIKTADEVAIFLEAEQLRVPPKFDHLHLAWCICEGVSTFVTRDGTHLTKLNNAMSRQYGLRILTPGRLIADFDLLANPSSYAPASLGGTSITEQKLSSKHVPLVVQSFLRNDLGEAKTRLWKLVDSSLAASVHRGSSSVLHCGSKCIGAWIGSDTDQSRKILVARSMSGRDGKTHAAAAIDSMLEVAIIEGIKFLEITDKHRSTEIDSIALERGFVHVGTTLRKVITCGRVGLRNIDPLLNGVASRLGEQYKQTLKLLATRIKAGEPDREAFIELSRLLYPTVITGVTDTWIVPIKPEYAEQLFDRNMAETVLFPMDHLRILNHEHVYYSNAQSAQRLQPGDLIAWYVSKGNRDGTMRVRGVSTVLDVVTDSAKVLFNRFKRLGVYEFNDVQSMDRPTAIHFGPFIPAAQPVALDEMNDIRRLIQWPNKLTVDQAEWVLAKGMDAQA